MSAFLSLNSKTALLVSLLFISAMGCTKIKEATTSKYKVTFDVNLISTDGDRSFMIECLEFEAFDAYRRDQEASMMSGKKPSVEKPKVYSFKTPGKPENKLTGVIELPSTKVICAVENGFIVVRNGEEASEVFVPKSDTTIKVSYNMYTKTLYKADSAGAKVDLIKN